MCLEDLPTEDITKLRIKFTTDDKDGKGYVRKTYVKICYKAEGTYLLLNLICRATRKKHQNTQYKCKKKYEKTVFQFELIQFTENDKICFLDSHLPINCSV